MTRGGRRSQRPNKTVALAFFLFVLVGVCTVFVLEYIDYRQGGESFIFKRSDHRAAEDRAVTQFNRRFTEFLEEQNIAYRYFIGADRLFHFKVETGFHPLKNVVARFREIAAAPDLQVGLSEIQKNAKGMVQLFRLSFAGHPTHVVLFSTPAGIQKPDTEVGPKAEGASPRIAFIIDDVGNRKGVAETLKELKIPITAAIIPNTPYAREEAMILEENQLETLIHLPMVPKNNSGRHYASGSVVRPDSNESDITAIVRRALRILPQARGINNHEGSLVTSSADSMERVLRVLKKEGLFFIDSRTTADTVGYAMAKRLKIRTASRDVFLDSVQSYSHARQQIQRLTDIATQKGKAIAIGHPFDSTLRAIRDAIPAIHSRGVKIVFASRLLE